jgi:hypothetical protein
MFTRAAAASLTGNAACPTAASFTSDASISSATSNTAAAVCSAEPGTAPARSTHRFASGAARVGIDCPAGATVTSQGGGSASEREGRKQTDGHEAERKGYQMKEEATSQYYFHCVG